jgi:hypothetical protein
VTDPNGNSATIQVGSATTYSRAGTSASFGDVNVGSFVVGEGTFGSSPTTIEAATVGIGLPGPGNGPGPNTGDGSGLMGPGFVPRVPGSVVGVGSNARGVRAK